MSAFAAPAEQYIEIRTAEEFMSYCGKDSGTYALKLMNDIDICSTSTSTYVYFYTDTVLDLNGHTLNCTQSIKYINYYAIEVRANSLTINDSSAAKTGKITSVVKDSTAENPFAFAIKVGDLTNKSGSTLIMNGGTITKFPGRSSSIVGTVTVGDYATFIMNSGKIVDNIVYSNKARQYNGGVCLLHNKPDSTGKIILGGDAVVYNNGFHDGAQSNIYIQHSDNGHGKIYVSEENPLTDDALFGLSFYPSVFPNGKLEKGTDISRYLDSSCQDYTDKFYIKTYNADNSDTFGIEYKDGQFLAIDHTHKLNGNTCTICGFDLDRYKENIRNQLANFAMNNVREEAMELEGLLKLVEDSSNAFDEATTKEEVDKIYADTLKALDEFVLETHMVAAVNATVTKAYKPEKSAKYEIATVKIPEADGIKNGKWFVYWVDQDKNIVSSYSTYSFYVVEDRTLTPVYVAPSVYEAERAKAILVTDIVRADDNGDGTATLFAEHSASKAAVGDAILQHGVIYTTDAAQKDNLTVDNDNVNKTVAAKTNTSLSGLLKAVIDVEENDTVYAKSYMTDANGNTVYGSAQTLSIGKFTTSADSDFEVLDFDNALEQAEEIIVTADEAPVVTETETETAPSFMSVLMSILNAVMALVQAIIALF
ncbi:MAG: hypothetical protein MJ147_08605 [Clostridia bacterium]|nr:hypothetical protein [Clostridia bacterium]